ncbi:MAG: helix-turn-helix domain-containing protein [Actinobacteria bacterium]|nr:helix-turn-helix domain-containing protein [Actinomycetota bacterium]
MTDEVRTVQGVGRAQAQDAWGRLLSSTHLPWSIAELDADAPGFRATVRRRHLADLVLVDCTCDPCSGTRRAHDIAATDGEYLVMLMTLSGREVVGQGGRQAQLRPGSVVVWDSTTPAEFVVQERLVKRSLVVPKAALAEVGSRGMLLTGTVLDSSAPAVTLLGAYLDGLSSTLDDLPLAALPAARNATIELLAAALQDAPAGPPGHPAVVRAAAEAHVDRHLGDPALVPASVAAALGVSLRTLQRAFAPTGEGVAGHIRTRRLARARDELLAGRTVAQVARRWHYADASHFSRTFKQQFGHNPSELPGPAARAR